MDEVFRHYSAILDKLLREPYYKFYFQNPLTREYGEWIDDDILMISGSFRTCIVDNRYDWVVKFGDYDDCDREVRNYSAAKCVGLGNCFVESHFIGVYRKKINFYRAEDIADMDPSTDNDDWVDAVASSGLDMEEFEIILPLYAYKRANEAHISWSLSADDSKLGRSIKSPIAEEHMDVAVALWKNWGESLFWKFDTFCREHGIDDLHCDNIGEIDGRFVIIDYAGCNV